jgi:hypothetical protein
VDALRERSLAPGGELTAEQREIVEAPPESRIVVTAGAGTGKTAVLIARLEHLVRSCGLSPGQELLVLSFTRSAVRLIKDRLHAAGGDARYVRAVTFDSFATRLLSEFQPEGEWVHCDYDGRIVAAVDLVRNNSEVRQFLAQYRHIVVDEVQDLVSERAEFVKALLLTSDAGFTLLGDPAQGIYNFQLEGEARRLGSWLLYAWIENRFGNEVAWKTLSLNFRAQSGEARTALWAGAALATTEPEFESVRFELETQLLNLLAAEPLCLAARRFAAESQSTAILCRTNGEALVISKMLFECGVPHRLQRLATEQVIAPWLALALRDCKFQQIGKKAFILRLEQLSAWYSELPDPEEAWRLLKRMDRRRQDDLLLPQIAAAIRRHDTPDELTVAPQAALTVSTIHRAKGLEFDRVIVVDFRDDFADDELTAAEETRVLYVAMTRPRRDLLRLGCPDTRGLSSKKNPGERWVRRKAAWMTLGFEVRGEDIHSADPAGTFMCEVACVPELQDYIATGVRPGDPLEVDLLTRSSSGATRAFYSVKHAGHLVGVTSETFSNALRATLTAGWRQSKWPVRLEGLHVECIDTVAGTEAASLRAGLGSSGLWLRVRPFGLADLKYEKDDAV